MTKSIISPGNYENSHWANQVISRERLAFYLAQSNGDMSAALMLYQRNLAVSSDLYQWLALAADYEHTLWIRNFRHAFVTLRKKDRHQVHSTVDLVNHLRNRVAHHERLIQVNLKQEIEAMLRLLGWISPESLDWATANLPSIQVN